MIFKIEKLNVPRCTAFKIVMHRKALITNTTIDKSNAFLSL